MAICNFRTRHKGKINISVETPGRVEQHFMPFRKHINTNRLRIVAFGPAGDAGWFGSHWRSLSESLQTRI